MTPEFYIGSTAEVPVSGFDICVCKEGSYLIRFKGSQEDLADNFVALGLIRKLYQEGNEVYLLINEADINKFI